jgi:phosphoribosylaminoimidazole carboxylase PurE protein
MKEIVIIAGSESDMSLVKPAIELAKELNLDVELQIYSAHRNLDELLDYLTALEKTGTTKVIIAVAGLAAALPGVVAAKVKLPVIGVPVDAGPLNGIDALLSIAQMPRGVPVATMAIGKAGMLNAIYYAERILNLCKSL